MRRITKKKADEQSEQRRAGGKCSFRSATLSYLIVFALNCGIAYIWAQRQPAAAAAVAMSVNIVGCRGRGNIYNNCMHFSIRSCYFCCSCCCCCCSW